MSNTTIGLWVLFAVLVIGIVVGIDAGKDHSSDTPTPTYHLRNEGDGFFGAH
jgi:hypothetical protein